MELTKIKATLDGQEINLPEEWQGLQIQASFENESTGANIQTESFTFTGKGRQVILDHIDQGYFFEGVPFDLQIRKTPLNYLAFEGFLDLQNSFEDLSTDRVKSKIKKLRGLNTFGEQISGVSFGYLDSLGLINSEEVEYLVEKRKNFVEIVSSLIVIYLLVKETIELTRRLAKDIIDLASLIAGGGLTGALGGVLLLAGQIIVNIAYGVAIVKAIIELVEDLLSYFISPVRKYKTCSYYELMRGACQYLGYDFQTTISDLSNIYFLPSNPNDEKIESGVPRPLDSGYNVGDFFRIVGSMFSANVAIIDNTVYFENRDSDFFIRQSTYQLPSVFINQKRKNGDELKGTRLVSFQSDPVDEFTIQNAKGTHYEIKTIQSDYKNGEEFLTIDSVDDRFFPYALVSRKNELNDLEKILKTLASLADSVVNAFGGSSNLSQKVKDRVGMMKLGTDSHTVARAFYMTGGKIPINHRDLFSARGLYENYIKADSFVLSVNGGQKEVFDNVRVRFGFEDFLKLVENSYFTTEDGRTGKVTSINWTIDGDFAELSFWTQDPNPTDKLIERYIEPD